MSRSSDEPEIRALRGQIGKLPEEIGPAVLIDRDMLDVGQLKTCLPQAVGDRLRRKAGPVLDAAEALLLRCRDELAVTNERGRRIAVEGIEAKNDHPFASCTVTPAVFRPTNRFLCQFQASVIMVVSSERSVDQPSNSGRASRPPLELADHRGAAQHRGT